MVVAISSATDAHIDLVRPYLREEVVVIDPQAINKGCELSFAFISGRPGLSYAGRQIKGVRSVWFRKPEAYDPQIHAVSKGYEAYSCSALNRFTFELKTQFADALWVPHPSDANRADNKMYQLQKATEAGFAVPPTLATSNISRAEAFINHYSNVIVKTFSTHFVRDSDAYRFFPSTCIKGKGIDLSGLHLAPAIFQQAIKTKRDIRVTVVGQRVFAAAISDKGVEGRREVRDWRAAYSAGQGCFSIYSLPRAIHDACIGLVASLNLYYGAIDLVQDYDGKYWFLEINTNGQWGFIEKDTGLPIAQAMARLLEQR